MLVRYFLRPLFEVTFAKWPLRSDLCAFHVSCLEPIYHQKLCFVSDAASKTEALCSLAGVFGKGRSVRGTVQTQDYGVLLHRG